VETTDDLWLSILSRVRRDALLSIRGGVDMDNLLAAVTFCKDEVVGKAELVFFR
jgi:hypothetical protein